MTAPHQLSFALPPSVTLEAEDFFVSAANIDAWRQVTAAAWPGGKLVLTGAEGAGKSHLVRVWQARSGARVIAAAHLAEALAVDRPGEGACVAVEGADALPQAAEEPLFHLHNRLMATGGRLLLTARTAPGRWPVALPDLASRMQATPVARIGPPDDDLLRALLLKQFADRQLMPGPRVIDHLAAHLDRSFAAVAEAVARLDVMSLSQKSPITLTLARAVTAPGPPGGDLDNTRAAPQD